MIDDSAEMRGHLLHLTFRMRMIKVSVGHSFSWLTHNNSIASAAVLFFPVPVLARTRTERVGLQNAAVHEFSSSGEGWQSRFWGVSLRHDYSLHPLLPNAAVIVFFPASLVIGTASVLHCIERDDYTNNASGSAAGYNFLIIISIIYMFITFRSHVHISNITNMFIFFWIKLLLKLPKFLTIDQIVKVSE